MLVSIKSKLLKDLTLGELAGGISLLAAIAGASFYLGHLTASIPCSSNIQKLESELQGYKASLASIKPHLELKESFNIKNNIIAKHSTNIPETSAPIDNQFLAATNIPE